MCMFLIVLSTNIILMLLLNLIYLSRRCKWNKYRHNSSSISIYADVMCMQWVYVIGSLLGGTASHPLKYIANTVQDNQPNIFIILTLSSESAFWLSFFWTFLLPRIHICTYITNLGKKVFPIKCWLEEEDCPIFWFILGRKIIS